MRRLLLPLLLVTPFLSGCWILAVGAGTVLISQDIIDSNTYVAQVQMDSRTVWLQTKHTLGLMSVDLVEADEDLKSATATYDGALVHVQVETFDIGQTVIRVNAKKFGVNNGAIASEVLRKILKSLG
ncbi:MAG: hypothetical protein E2O39_01270 [Planctomycetota bacterium]|nr:MAG: hypothetical protein E2O39_01270 [Planctomycetota bacterium]